MSVLFWEIDYKKLTPLITKVFGSTDFIGIADSGINELFKPPRRGRPPKAAKKRQRQDFDVTFVTKVFGKELLRKLLS